MFNMKVLRLIKRIKLFQSASLLTRVGVFWSGQNDSGIGQCPMGTPVFGFGRT